METTYQALLALAGFLVIVGGIALAFDRTRVWGLWISGAAGCCSVLSFCAWIHANHFILRKPDQPFDQDKISKEVVEPAVKESLNKQRDLSDFGINIRREADRLRGAYPLGFVIVWAGTTERFVSLELAELGKRKLRFDVTGVSIQSVDDPRGDVVEVTIPNTFAPDITLFDNTMKVNAAKARLSKVNQVRCAMERLAKTADGSIYAIGFAEVEDSTK